MRIHWGRGRLARGQCGCQALFPSWKERIEFLSAQKYKCKSNARLAFYNSLHTLKF